MKLCIDTKVFSHFFFSKFRNSLAPVNLKSSVELTGKIVVVTGANSGIGKEIARILSVKDCVVILGCRHKSEGQATARQIQSFSGNKKVLFEHLDLTSFKSIFLFAGQVSKHVSSTNYELYCLINNAGIFYNKHELTEDKFDISLQTNYLGPFYLTLLLLPILKKSSHARIINVSSEAHKVPVNINVDKFISSELFLPPNKFEPIPIYGETKLYLMLSSLYLASLLKETNVTINCVDPGDVNTNVLRYFNEYNTLKIRFFIWLRFKTAVKAAAEIASLVLDPALQKVSGKLWKSLHEESPSTLASSFELASTLWYKTLTIIPETSLETQ